MKPLTLIAPPVALLVLESESYCSNARAGDVAGSTTIVELAAAERDETDVGEPFDVDVEFGEREQPAAASFMPAVAVSLPFAITLSVSAPLVLLDAGRRCR